MAEKTIKTPQAVPSTPHYAILFFRSVSLHNYWDDKDPGTEQVVEYVVYDTKEEWESSVELRTRFPERGREKWRAVYVVPAQITTKVSVKAP